MYTSVFLLLLGWEYGVTIPLDDKPKSWVAAEKMYHVHRRKRLIRQRKKMSNKMTAAVVRKCRIRKVIRRFGYIIRFLSLCFLQRQDSVEGWEYSSLIGRKFHRKERSSDMLRRRRWRRKMVPSDCIGASAIFRLEGALVGLDLCYF